MDNNGTSVWSNLGRTLLLTSLGFLTVCGIINGYLRRHSLDSINDAVNARILDMTDTESVAANEQKFATEVSMAAPSKQDGLGLLSERRLLLRNVCRSRSSLVLHALEDYAPPEYRFGCKENIDAGRKQPVFHMAVINEKNLICLINKAGTKATKTFFKQKNGGNLPSITALNYVKLMKNRKKDVYYKAVNLPVQMFLKHDRTVRKILIVRHPLQRLVSAYYQVVVSGMRDGRGIDNFTQFIQDRVFNGRYYNAHWLTYQEACYPCLTDYDYILQAETLDAEFPQISPELGFGYNTSFVNNHGNPHVTDCSAYKYDGLLTELERDDPILFNKILQKYAIDMEMFGYTWINHKSGTV